MRQRKDLRAHPDSIEVGWALMLNNGTRSAALVWIARSHRARERGGRSRTWATAVLSRDEASSHISWALALRWAYAGALFAFMGADGVTGPDSVGYMSRRRLRSRGHQEEGRGLGLAHPEHRDHAAVHVADQLHALLFGSLAPLSYVLMQGVFDAGTCLFVFGLSLLGSLFRGAAAIAAAAQPTQIILSGLVYTDTIFVFLVR